MDPVDEPDSSMYPSIMRRIQIYIEEELDEALQAEAARTGRSKAAIIRESVKARIGLPGKARKDPIPDLVSSSRLLRKCDSDARLPDGQYSPTKRGDLSASCASVPGLSRRRRNPLELEEGTLLRR
jgi:hypothetical protein